MDEKRLAEIQARCDAATPGSWQADRNSVTVRSNHMEIRVCNCPGARCEADAAFIAAARDDVPALLSFAATLAAERDAERRLVRELQYELLKLGERHSAEVEQLRGMSPEQLAEDGVAKSVSLRLRLAKMARKLDAPDYWVASMQDAERRVRYFREQCYTFMGEKVEASVMLEAVAEGERRMADAAIKDKESLLAANAKLEAELRRVRGLTPEQVADEFALNLVRLRLEVMRDAAEAKAPERWVDDVARAEATVKRVRYENEALKARIAELESRPGPVEVATRMADAQGETPGVEPDFLAEVRRQRSIAENAISARRHTVEVLAHRLGLDHETAGENEILGALVNARLAVEGEHQIGGRGFLSFVSALAAERDQARSDAEAARKEAAHQERARHLNGQIADGFKAEVELLRGMSAGEVAEQNALMTVNLRLSLHEKCWKLGAPDYWVESVVAAEKSVREAAEFKAMLQKRLDEANSSMKAMEARIAELEGVRSDQSNALQAAATEYPTGPAHPRQERLRGSSVLATIDAPPPDELREACRPVNGCQHTRLDKRRFAGVTRIACIDCGQDLSGKVAP